MTQAVAVLITVAKEEVAVCKSRIPRLQDGETLRDERFTNDTYCRETVLNDTIYHTTYNFLTKECRRMAVEGQRGTTEMASITKRLTLFAVAAALLLNTANSNGDSDYVITVTKRKFAPITGTVKISEPEYIELANPVEPETKAYTPTIPVTVDIAETEDFEEPETALDIKWTTEELNAVAKTLAGECYDDKAEDKRRVCEVICNRVSDGRFGGSTICEVLSAENQFLGYWTQFRPVSESDYEVAEQTLAAWYANGCNALSDSLFFVAGENRENKFF